MSIDPSTYKARLLDKLSNNSRTPFQQNISLTLSERNEENLRLKEYSSNPLNYYRRAYFIGGGGVASWFLPQYIKTVFNYRKSHNIPDNTIFTIFIYDYDVVENKNILRQNFIMEDVGKNKAQVLSERYNEIYPGIKVLYEPRYLFCKYFCSEIMLDRQLEETEYGDENKYLPMDFNVHSSFIFNFVDNETTKHQLDFYINQYESEEFFEGTLPCLYFTTGCDVSNGQVFNKKFRYSPYYTEYYQDVSFDKGIELIDEPVSCAEIAESATVEQTFDSNAFAATILNTLVNNTMNNFWATHAKEIKFVSSSSPKVETVTTMENYNYLRYVEECHSM